MGSVEVVVMWTELELGFSFHPVLIGPRISSFAQRGLDETLGLSVGVRDIGPGDAVLDVALLRLRLARKKPIRVSV